MKAGHREGAQRLMMVCSGTANAAFVELYGRSSWLILHRSLVSGSSKSYLALS
jgi:hypothetical protein